MNKLKRLKAEAALLAAVHFDLETFFDDLGKIDPTLVGKFAKCYREIRESVRETASRANLTVEEEGNQLEAKMFLALGSALAITGWGLTKSGESETCSAS